MRNKFATASRQQAEVNFMNLSYNYKLVRLIMLVMWAKKVEDIVCVGEVWNECSWVGEGLASRERDRRPNLGGGGSTRLQVTLEQSTKPDPQNMF